MKDCGREWEITGEGEGDAKHAVTWSHRGLRVNLTWLRGFFAVDPTKCGALWKFERERERDSYRHISGLGERKASTADCSGWPYRRFPFTTKTTCRKWVKKLELKFASSSFLLPGLVLFLAAGLKAHWGCRGVTHEGAVRVRSRKAELSSLRTQSVRESERGAAHSELSVRE